MNNIKRIIGITLIMLGIFFGIYFGIYRISIRAIFDLLFLGVANLTILKVVFAVLKVLGGIVVGDILTAVFGLVGYLII